jgi:hypothetical protein
MGSLLSLSPYAIAFVIGVVAGHAVPALYTVVMGWFQSSTTATAASDVATAVTDVVTAVEGATGTTPAAPTTTTTTTK